MAGDVKIPVFGQVKKRTAITGGVIVAGVFTVLWYRRRKAASSAAPAGTDSSQIDPQTGFPAGSAQDQAALGTLGGFGSVPVGSGPPAASGPPGPGNFTTNADWAQYAENYLTGSVGLDAALTGAALGRYIGGLPLTPDQVNVVTQAIAFAGLPPVAGHGGNPPGYLTAPPPPPPHRKPPPAKFITADGRSTVHDIAADNGDTDQQILHWNPGLARWWHLGKPVPAGTKVRVR